MVILVPASLVGRARGCLLRGGEGVWSIRKGGYWIIGSLVGRGGCGPGGVAGPAKRPPRWDQTNGWSRQGLAPPLAPPGEAW